VKTGVSRQRDPAGPGDEVLDMAGPVGAAKHSFVNKIGVLRYPSLPAPVHNGGWFDQN
jgi:hypothetical protein